MQYLLFQTEQLALDRSHEICISQGCTGDTTTYWFGVILHPITQEAAMQVTDDYQYLLTETEITELKNQKFMNDNGWFPNQPI